MFLCTALTVLVTSSAGTSPLRNLFWRRVCYLLHTEDIECVENNQWAGACVHRREILTENPIKILHITLTLYTPRGTIGCLTRTDTFQHHPHGPSAHSPDMSTSCRERPAPSREHALLQHEQHLQLLCWGQADGQRMYKPVHKPPQSAVLPKLRGPPGAVRKGACFEQRIKSSHVILSACAQMRFFNRTLRHFTR